MVFQGSSFEHVLLIKQISTFSPFIDTSHATLVALSKCLGARAAVTGSGECWSPGAEI